MPRSVAHTAVHLFCKTRSKRLDTVGFEAALQAWAARAVSSADRQVMLDGKALRGIHGEELAGVRLVALYAPEAGLVLTQAGGQDQGGAG